MTGWESDACTKLLRLARAQISLPSVPASNFLVEEGLIVNATTGVVQGPNLVLDAGPYGYCAPLYTYDRTNRFACLLMPAGVPIESRHLVVRVFEQLEKLWESLKSSYTRKYFLSQKLVLREITKRLGITCDLPVCIRDPKRRRSQLRIFNDLWQNLLSSKL